MNSVSKIVLLPEMIVKAFAVHIAALTDLPYIDFFERDLLHQFLHCLCQRALGNVGFCHYSASFEDRSHRHAWDKNKNETYLPLQISLVN